MIIYIKWFYIFSLVLFFIILNFTSRSTWHRLCVCLYCLNCYASYVFIYVQYYIVFSYMLSFVFRQNPFYRRVTPRLNRSSSLSSMAFLQQIPSTSSTSFLFGRESASPLVCGTSGGRRIKRTKTVRQCSTRSVCFSEFRSELKIGPPQFY